MRAYWTLISILLLAGCGRNDPCPAARLLQPAGMFSFVTPDGWYRTKLSGIAFIIVSTDSDHGARPNIYVDSVEPSGSLKDAAEKLIKQNRTNYGSYSVSQQTPFTTASGMAGLKINAGRKNRDALPLALMHYLVADGNRVLVITCSCAEPVKTKYEPVFDQAINSQQAEKDKPATP